MKRFKALLCLMILTFSFASPTFAAWKTYRVTARSYSYEMIDATCNFGVAKKDWSNAVTVVNNGSVPVYFYVGARFIAYLSPGREYTYRPYMTKSLRVHIYAVDQDYGKQSIVVKTTRGSINTIKAR